MSFLKKLRLLSKSYRLKHHKTEEEQEQFEDISNDETKRRFETERDNYVWLDVRSQMEFDGGHIPGAKLIPVDQLEDRIAEVGEKDKKYIVYCQSGGRSAAACTILNAKGYKNLFNAPGMGEWDGPTEE